MRLDVGDSAVLTAAWLGARGTFASSPVEPKLGVGQSQRVYFYVSKQVQDRWPPLRFSNPILRLGHCVGQHKRKNDEATTGGPDRRWEGRRSNTGVAFIASRWVLMRRLGSITKHGMHMPSAPRCRCWRAESLTPPAVCSACIARSTRSGRTSDPPLARPRYARRQGTQGTTQSASNRTHLRRSCTCASGMRRASTARARRCRRATLPRGRPPACAREPRRQFDELVVHVPAFSAGFELGTSPR